MERAVAQEADPPSALETVGLIGTDPAARIADARTAYEAGELEAADRSLAAAAEARDGSDGAGRLRVGAAGGVILGLDLLAMGVAAARRRRSRRARAALAAAAARPIPASPPGTDWPQ